MLILTIKKLKYQNICFELYLLDNYFLVHVKFADNRTRRETIKTTLARNWAQVQCEVDSIGVIQDARN